MKLSFFLGVFLISSALNIEVQTYNTLSNGFEYKYTGFKSLEKYYFTMSVNKGDSLEIKIKLQNPYNSTSFEIYYIGHSSSSPTSYSSKTEGLLFLVYEEGYYKSSYTSSNSNINYVSFRITPKVDIYSISLKITKTSSEASYTLFIIIFFLIFALCCILCIFLVFCKGLFHCFKVVKSTNVEPSPQPHSQYAPIQPQPMVDYPTSQPQYFQPQVQYIPPQQTSVPQYMASGQNYQI